MQGVNFRSHNSVIRVEFLILKKKGKVLIYLKMASCFSNALFAISCT